MSYGDQLEEQIRMQETLQASLQQQIAAAQAQTQTPIRAMGPKGSTPQWPPAPGPEYWAEQEASGAQHGVFGDQPGYLNRSNVAYDPRNLDQSRGQYMDLLAAQQRALQGEGSVYARQGQLAQSYASAGAAEQAAAARGYGAQSQLAQARSQQAAARGGLSAAAQDITGRVGEQAALGQQYAQSLQQLRASDMQRAQMEMQRRAQLEDLAAQYRALGLDDRNARYRAWLQIMAAEQNSNAALQLLGLQRQNMAQQFANQSSANTWAAAGQGLQSGGQIAQLLTDYYKAQQQQAANNFYAGAQEVTPSWWD